MRADQYRISALGIGGPFPSLFAEASLGFDDEPGDPRVCVSTSVIDDAAGASEIVPDVEAAARVIEDAAASSEVIPDVDVSATVIEDASATTTVEDC